MTWLLPVQAMVLALLLWVLLHHPELAVFIEENGPVETAAVVGYGLALIMLGACLFAATSRKLVLCLMVLCIFFAAREMDLHKTLTGTSMLRLSFYLNGPLTFAKAASALSVFAFVCSAAYLVLQHGRSLWARARMGNAYAQAALTFMAALVFSKSLDRTTAILREDFGLNIAESIAILIQANEEIIELTLPLIVALAAAQYLIQSRIEQRSQLLKKAT